MILLRVAALAFICGCASDFTIEGPPSIALGTGIYEYKPVGEWDELPLVRGIQGGEHVWVGIIVHNMNPNGLRLDLELTTAADDRRLGFPQYFIIDLFERSSDAEWEYAGIPAQFEAADGADRLVRMIVTATDLNGRQAFSTMQFIPVPPQ